MMTRKEHRNWPSSYLASLGSVAFVAFLVAAARDFSKSPGSLNNYGASLPRHGRSLVDSAVSLTRSSGTAIMFKASKEDSIDDDITRDDACRDYLMNFLNGTTDAKDECTAMYKAYQVADCKDYSQNDHALEQQQQKQSTVSSLWADAVDNTPDDKMIDDAFEKWECCSSIGDYYGKHCREDQNLDAIKLLGIVSVLVVCGLMKTMVRLLPRLQWVPDAAACIVVGAFVGGLLRLIGGHRLTDKLAFDNNLFLHILLPPIIFQASLTIDKAAFRRDLFPILTFAVLGTFLSAVAIGHTTHFLSNLPLLDSLLFGALMSSIDPVATLGILTSMGVSQRDTLYTLVFGESLLNDGVSIVLFDSLVKHMGDSKVVDDATVANTLVSFVVVAGGSILIGGLCGACSTLYFWLLHKMHTAVTEVGLFFAWAFIPYYIADGFGFSGIISIMVMGFVMDFYIVGGHMSEEGEWMEYMELSSHDENGIHRVEHPVEPILDRFVVTCRKAFSGRGLLLSKSRHHVGFVAEVISSLMETAIFAYLGLFLFNDRVFDLKATFAGLFACVSSRAVIIIGLSLLVNTFVWMDVESFLGRLWRNIGQRTASSFRGGSNHLLRPEGRADDDSDCSDSRNYLDMKTQLILFSAGVRGAVSYALVQNIPVYDAVTETGSHFKAQLRSMTSCAIVILMFAFGALTYFTVKRDVLHDPSQHRGPTRRLLSTGLTSEPGSPDGESDYDYNSSIEQFEIDGRRALQAMPVDWTNTIT